MRGIFGASAILGGVLALTSGCAATGPRVTDAEITQTELAIRSAENATATQHARDLLDRARTGLSGAQNERASKHFDRARALLDESRAAAAAAESKANAMRLEESAATTRRQNEEMESRIKGFSSQSQRP